MAPGETSPAFDAELAALETALAAQYEILRPLGRGGMGAVYLARERLLERLVAVKVLHRVDAESHERFLREARAAARLTHPNIVPLYSFGQTDDTVFYVMGYVEGESLESLLRRVGRLSPGEAARMLGELSEALDFAHRNGVVHRDVKPDNVMIERDTGRVVLTDFGIARMESGGALTQTGVIVGTPQYMSPEQAAGDRAIDGRSDLYSLGLIGYRMVTGRLPFEGPTTRELMAQHISRAPLPVASLVDDLPTGLSTAIMRCLEKEPSSRWTSGQELRGALRADSETDLAVPDGLEHHVGLGVNFLVGGYTATLLFEGVAAARQDRWWFGFAFIAGPLIASCVLAAVLNARRAGLTTRQALRILYAPPARWGLWWPRAFRRPGDLWDRLPAPVRRSRHLMSVSNAWVFGSMLFYVPFIIHGIVSPEPAGAMTALAIGSIGFLAGAAGALAGTFTLRRWAGTMPAATRRRWLTEPTWGSKFWQRPEIASRLDASAGAPKLAIPSTPAAIASGVASLAVDLEALDAALAAEVRASAGELVALIAEFDREIASFVRHLEPADAERAAERLEALGPARAGEADAVQRMRRLLEDQVALMQDLARRRGAIEQRRANALDRLRSLWMHLQGLRARQIMERADAAEITARIRAACANVAYLNAAFDEVNDLTDRPATTPVP